LRAEHGLLADQRRDDLEREREADKSALWDALLDAGVAEGDQPAEAAAFVDAALRFVAAARCELCLLPLEDVLGQLEQPNLPGTTDEHPNWRRRQSAPAEELLQAPEVVRRLRAVAEQRGGEGKGEE
jgi:4-alpha-glucanotransferase